MQALSLSRALGRSWHLQKHAAHQSTYTFWQSKAEGNGAMDSPIKVLRVGPMGLGHMQQPAPVLHQASLGNPSMVPQGFAGRLQGKTAPAAAHITCIQEDAAGPLIPGLSPDISAMQPAQPHVFSPALGSFNAGELERLGLSALQQMHEYLVGVRVYCGTRLSQRQHAVWLTVFQTLRGGNARQGFLLTDPCYQPKLDSSGSLQLVDAGQLLALATYTRYDDWAARVKLGQFWGGFKSGTKVQEIIARLTTPSTLWRTNQVPEVQQADKMAARYDTGACVGAPVGRQVALLPSDTEDNLGWAIDSKEGWPTDSLESQVLQMPLPVQGLLVHVGSTQALWSTWSIARAMQSRHLGEGFTLVETPRQCVTAERLIYLGGGTATTPDCLSSIRLSGVWSGVPAGATARQLLNTLSGKLQHALATVNAAQATIRQCKQVGNETGHGGVNLNQSTPQQSGAIDINLSEDDEIAASTLQMLKSGANLGRPVVACTPACPAAGQDSVVSAPQGGLVTQGDAEPPAGADLRRAPALPDLHTELHNGQLVLHNEARVCEAICSLLAALRLPPGNPQLLLQFLRDKQAGSQGVKRVLLHYRLLQAAVQSGSITGVLEVLRDQFHIQPPMEVGT